MAGRRGREPQPGKEPEKPGTPVDEQDPNRLRDGYAEPTYQGRGRHRKPDKTDDQDST